MEDPDELKGYSYRNICDDYFKEKILLQII